MITKLKVLLNYDDALDAFGLHGIGGIVGAIGTGVLQTSAVNPEIANGLLAVVSMPVIVQIIAVSATILFSAGMTYGIGKTISIFTILRTDEKEELNGLDDVIHRKAYEYSNS